MNRKPPRSGDRRGWAAYHGQEALDAMSRVLDGTSTNVELDLEHVKRSTRLAWYCACRVKKYHYWDVMWTRRQK